MMSERKTGLATRGSALRINCADYDFFSWVHFSTSNTLPAYTESKPTGISAVCDEPLGLEPVESLQAKRLEVKRLRRRS